MAIRIEWDEFEIALLIEACEEVLRKGKPKSEVVKTVSSNLRKRAISKNIAIDDVFRNENGIALQMQKMAYLLTHGEKGMPGASKLYAEVAELREENPKKFEEILKRAKEEIEMTDLSQQNIDKKALFAQWLNEHPIKKYTPSAIIDALDVASRYCVSKKVCKDGFWSMQNKAEFNAATSKLLSFRLFRLKYRSAAAKMDKAIPLYKAFLDSYVASREENTAEFEGEALNEPDSMLSTAAANSDDIIRLDFSDIGSLIFSKPVCLNYKDHTFTDFNSWASLYAKVAFLLKQDYPQIIVDGGSLSEGAAPEFSMNSKALRKPKAITDGLFIETNHSATEIASRIATLLRLCGVDLNKVSITYTLKKEAEQKRTSQARSENEKLYEKLYSISRIYDDPAGLSLNRITGLLGQSDDRELVQGILDHAPWAHRIENGIYSFASADTISARNEKKAGKDDTISDSAFYDYLDKTLCMAEPTCRSYVSAIRSAEKYAKDYGFTSYRIYDVTTSDAVALLNALMKDDGFAAYNIRQHNRFRAAFTKFAEMAGQSIAVKKTGAQLQNKPQEQPIAPFDKEKYIEILMCRYRNGITFDSIDFDNFRETYANGIYSYSDNLTTVPLDTDKLASMISEIIKQENTPDKRYKDKYIVTLTEAERAFNKATCTAFDIPEMVIDSVSTEKELIKTIFRLILTIDKSNAKFDPLYRQRKDLLGELKDCLSEIAEYCKVLATKGENAIYYLTDLTILEKERVIAWLNVYGQKYDTLKLISVLKKVFPDLASYLTKFRFKNKLLDDYFDAYKYQKVVNHILPSFETVVDEQATKMDFVTALKPRAAIVEKLDVTNSRAFFLDALGVEYLGFIQEKCSEYGLSVDVSCGRCELPSITSQNKEFVATLQSKGCVIADIKDLDDIKHHGEDSFDYEKEKNPIYLIRELEIIDELLKKIQASIFNGSYEKAIIISDHGASRLAVLHETENIWSMATSGEHSGRCCPVNELNSKPNAAIEENGFWVLANYDRFKGGRKANVEVHGGASLEEVAVPIIEITRKQTNIEAILHRLDLMGICVSTGSACDSVSTQISHVLKAIKLKDNYARGTIRISFGKENTFEEANIIAESLIRILKK